MNKESLQLFIRDFIKEEIMMSKVEFMTNSEDLGLDSLSQTELRVMLSEEYGLKSNLESMPADITSSIDSIVSFVLLNAKKSS